MIRHFLNHYKIYPHFTIFNITFSVSTLLAFCLFLTSFFAFMKVLFTLEAWVQKIGNLLIKTGFFSNIGWPSNFGVCCIIPRYGDCSGLLSILLRIGSSCQILAFSGDLPRTAQSTRFDKVSDQRGLVSISCMLNYNVKWMNGLGVTHQSLGSICFWCTWESWSFWCPSLQIRNNFCMKSFLKTKRRPS